MTDDQKKALVVAGGVVVLAIVLYMVRQQSQQVPTAIAVNPSPTIGDLGGAPGYTTYNIAPVGAPGVNQFPVVGAPSTNIVPGNASNSYTFGGAVLGGSPTNISTGGRSINLGAPSLSTATYGYPGSGGCCCDNTTVPGTINTGNAPTSIDQLLSWYGQINPSLASQMQTAVNGFTIPAGTISDQTTPLLPASNNSY